jgi:hypothetical protein
LPDVNLFLQCRTITSLAWTDLGEAGPITLYLGLTLQREIDRLKGDGSPRRAKRAREANTLFRKLLRAPHTSTVLREANPRVTLTFLPHLDAQRPKPPQLDLSAPDDCHIEEALAFRATYPAVRTAILTHDTGPMLTARHVGLEYFEVPDSWLLEPEKDDRQKQIDELARQVKILQKQYPQLSLKTFDKSGSPIEVLSFSIVEYDPPSDETIQNLIAELRSHYPRQEDFKEPPVEERWSLFALTGYPRKYQAPSQDKIERYQHDYEDWLAKTEEFLKALPDKLTGRTHLTDIAFRLENIGTESAKSVLIDFSATPGFLLRPPAKPDAVTQLDSQLPKRPEPPQGQYINVLSPWEEGLGRIPGIWSQEATGAAMDIASFLHHQQEALDPSEFYFRDKPQGFVSGVGLSCMHFRHRLEPANFPFEIRWEVETRSNSGAIRCRIAAENLPEPIEHVLPIRVTFEHGDIEMELERYRPRMPRLRFRGT